MPRRAPQVVADAGWGNAPVSMQDGTTMYEPVRTKRRARR